MEWVKEGLIYCPDGKMTWAKHSALQPTPYQFDPTFIRVFVAFRDDESPGVGRIGFVDVDAENPKNVLRVSEKPCLDVGIPGCFDDNGVVPCCVLEDENILYMWYSGHQLGHRVRNLAFTGLAYSYDKGETFNRWSNVPYLERTTAHYLWRAVHCILKDENSHVRMWYCAGNTYIKAFGKELPKYNIHHTSTRNAEVPPKDGLVCLSYEGDEHRLGRPWVVKIYSGWYMWFSYATPYKEYRIGHAFSSDGHVWKRREDPFDVSEEGWDSKMICFAAVVQSGDNTYMFYNGNNHGEEGFGYATLQSC